MKKVNTLWAVGFLAVCVGVYIHPEHILAIAGALVLLSMALTIKKA
jgi:hypothetical protein